MTNETTPPSATAFNDALAVFNTGNWAGALARVDEALAQDPALELAHLLRARCLVRLNEWMPAREAFAQTLRLNAGNYSAWLEAGHLCKQMGELKQAAMSYQRAIDVATERYEALLGMARVMLLMGELLSAQRAHQEAAQAAQAKGHAVLRQVHHLMGQYWLETGRHTEAAPCFVAALQVHQASGDTSVDAAAEIQMDLGMALLRLGRRDEALRVLTLASGATQEATLSRLAMLSFRQNLWQEALEVMRRCVALHPQSVNAHWNLAHLLTECWQMNEAKEVLAKAQALGEVPNARSLLASAAGRNGEVDETLARSRTEHWVEVGTLNDAQLAKRIDTDAIDVLLDLAGHTGQHRMNLFAKRAAPVQATYLGYPGSTGVPNIDWLLGDAVVTPEADDGLCSEQVYRLPGTVFCYAPEENYPFPEFKKSDAKRVLTFGSFNNVPKLTPHTLQLWARVLAAVPDSRLVLKAPSFTDAAAIAQRMAADRDALLTLKQGMRQRLQALPAWDAVQHTRHFEQALMQAASATRSV